MARRQWVCVFASVLALVAQPVAPRAQRQTPGARAAIAVRRATADGLSVQYLSAGSGPAIVLLHGYAETSGMWRPLIPRLAATHAVIAPDLPGIGGSALVAFLDPSAASTASSASAQPMSQTSRSTLSQMRLTPDEVRANQTGTEQVGSSFLAGVSTKVLAGDPSKPGFYTIILSVPANTTIPAHSHRDDRMATVVSGTWQFGYGDRFDEKALKRLPPGSVYSEPGGGNHFARTGAEPALVQITGIGPTDTRYVNPSDAPKTPDR